MKSHEEIQSFHKQMVEGIMNGFAKEQPVAIEKSEVYFTIESIDKFKEDLFKAIDDNSISVEQIEKAQDDILSLKKVTRSIEGKEVEVFVKG